MKKIFLSLIITSLFFSCGQFGGSVEDEKKDENINEILNPTDYSGEITVWSFTNEVEQMIPYFNQVYPNITVNFTSIPNQDEVYLNRIHDVMSSGVGAPDVFTGEAAFYRQFIDNEYWMALDGINYDISDFENDIVPYILDSTLDENGKVRALSWQATPGGLFYRRSIAEAVLGSGDPDVVSQYTSSLEGLKELGQLIKDEYGNEKYLLSSYSDMQQFVYNLKDEPYTDGNSFTTPETLHTYMEIAKEFAELEITKEGYWITNDENEEEYVSTSVWYPGWFEGMADASVMCYVLPTWGLHYVLKPSAEPEANNGEMEFTGDWGLATPPAAYSWGGTWIGVNDQTSEQQKILSYQFVKFVATNKNFLTRWAKDTGDFIANMDIIEDIKDDFSDPFLGGQNHYLYFYEEAQKVDVYDNGPYDFQIENAFGQAVADYVEGVKSYDDAITGFEDDVYSILGIDNKNSETITPLTLNSEVSGSFNNRNDIRIYTIDVQQGQNYNIYIENEFSGITDGADTNIDVYYENSPETLILEYSENFDLTQTPLTFTATESSTLYIKLISDNPDTTYYTIRVVEIN